MNSTHWLLLNKYECSNIKLEFFSCNSNFICLLSVDLSESISKINSICNQLDIMSHLITQFSSSIIFLHWLTFFINGLDSSLVQLIMTFGLFVLFVLDMIFLSTMVNMNPITKFYLVFNLCTNVNSSKYQILLFKLAVSKSLLMMNFSI